MVRVSLCFANRHIESLTIYSEPSVTARAARIMGVAAFLTPLGRRAGAQRGSYLRPFQTQRERRVGGAQALRSQGHGSRLGDPNSTVWRREEKG